MYNSPLYRVKGVGLILDVRKIILLTPVELKKRDSVDKFLSHATSAGAADDYDTQVLFTAQVAGRNEPLLFGLKAHDKADAEKGQMSVEEAEKHVRAWYATLVEMWEHYASRSAP